MKQQRYGKYYKKVKEHKEKMIPVLFGEGTEWEKRFEIDSTKNIYQQIFDHLFGTYPYDTTFIEWDNYELDNRIEVFPNLVCVHAD